MGNLKKKSFNKALRKLDPKKIGDENLLASDLGEKLGALENKSKITIRLDLRIIKQAKKESDELGVGYQKIINDRLLELFSIEKSAYLNKKPGDSAVFEGTIEDILKRLTKLEAGKKSELKKEA